MNAMAGRGPTPTRPRLRAELRGFRVERGLSLSDAANRLSWPTSKLAGIEHGQIGVSAPDLAALLEIYGIREPGRVAALQELARGSRERMWWHAHEHAIPESYLELIIAEADASRITHFHPTFVPGLLQTRSYAVAVTPATTLKAGSQDDVDARVNARMRRQREVLHGPDPARLTAVLDETVLRRRIGSNATMREQLDHLVRSVNDDVITLAVVTIDAGPHPGLLGPFMLLEYDDPRIDDVLCFEGTSGNVVVRHRSELASEYMRLANRLLDIGLRNEAAVRWIQSARDAFA